MADRTREGDRPGCARVVLVALYVATAGLVRQLTVLNVGPLCLIILIYAGVGVVVARRQPRNPVGWILLVFVLLFMLGSDAGYYAVYSYSLGHHGLPFAALAVLTEPLWIPALAVVPPTHVPVWSRQRDEERPPGNSALTSK